MNMARFYKINEMAIGATGSGSIAAVPSRFNGGDAPQRRELRGGEGQWRRQGIANRQERENFNAPSPEQIAKTKAQIEKAKQLKAEKTPRFKNFVSRLITRKGVKESIDVAGITSQLKGLENKNNFDNRNTVTYGVEDDEGNLMKVTVKSEDAKSFENRLALELGEIENNKIYGYQNSGISLAEVLYNLKDEFNIVDVEFPEIPSDIIYNADKASLGEQTPDPTGMENNQMDKDENGQPINGDDQTQNDMGNIPMSNSNEEMPDDLDNEDMDQGQDFVEDEGDNDFKTMFNQLMQLMTAQAEKEKAIADAEAEKARALQAEYSAKAANHEITRQEELVRMQAEIDAQKKKEKDAKQLASIAKYRVNKDKGAGAMNFESTGSFLKDYIINEYVDIDSDLEDENTIRKQLIQARMKYKIDPNDDAAMKAYKSQAMQAVNNQLNDKLRQIKAKNILNQKEKTLAQQQAQKNQQTQQNQQMQQNQQSVGNPADAGTF